MSVALPPRWAEAILLVLLAPIDRQTVSGDLLEEYRESVLPARGRRRADVWYVSQVAWFAWHGNRVWAALLGGAFVTRTAADWLLPTADFHARATMSTIVTVAILMCAGCSASWRSGSLRAGALAGIATSFAAAVISAIGAATLFVLSQNPETYRAIDASGGLLEVFTLPVMLAMPGAMLGAFGGWIGRTARL